MRGTLEAKHGEGAHSAVPLGHAYSDEDDMSAEASSTFLARTLRHLKDEQAHEQEAAAAAAAAAAAGEPAPAAASAKAQPVLMHATMAGGSPLAAAAAGAAGPGLKSLVSAQPGGQP